MRRSVLRSVITSALLVTFISTPVRASPYNGTSGTLSCGSGYVTIRDRVVTSNNNCNGSISIPNGVTSIGPSAFNDATRLYSIDLPATVISIGDSAFSGATSLEFVSFSSGSQLTTIGDSAFRGANFFYITIPATVTSIGDSAYSGTQARTVTFAAGSALKTIGPSAFDGATYLASIVIPADVESIGAYAFNGATNLSTLTFADNSKLTSIGQRAFYGATGLSSVVIPSSVTQIEALAFYNATSLQTLTFEPNSRLTRIGSDAFAYANSLTSITIPANITYIDAGAFYAATQLETVTFENSSKLLYIDVFAFKGATSLVSLEIPSNVTHIGSNAFEGSTSLTSVTFGDDSQLEFIGSYAFKNTPRLNSINIPSSVETIGFEAFYCEFYYECDLTSVTFGDNSQLEYLGWSAFAYQESLVSIVIPAGVTEIGGGAFAGASSLTEVFFLGDAPYITYGFGSAFAGVGEAAKVYISSSAQGFGSAGEDWQGLTVQIGVYSVTYNSKNGSEVTSGSFISGGSISNPKLTTRSGYTFAGWSATDGGAVVSFPYSPPQTAAITLYAKWILNTYTVSYESKGGTAVTSGSFTTGGSIASAPTAPTLSGHTFAGWSATDGGAVVSFPYSPPQTAAITLYAKWTKNPLKAVASTKPSVTGKAVATAKGTNKLTAKKGIWTGYPTPVISYQWYACTSQVKSATAAIPKSCKKISKATKSTLAVTDIFKGKFIAVAVTGKGTGTTATTWLSKSTAKVN